MSESYEMKIERQIELEKEMRDLGAEAYKANLEKATESGNETRKRSVSNLLSTLIAPTAAHIAQKLANFTPQRGKQPVAMVWLPQIDPEVAALIGGRIILDGITGGSLFSMVAASIGSGIEDQIRFARIKENDKELWKALSRRTKSGHAGYKHKAMTKIANDAQDGWTPWDFNTRVQVGKEIVQSMIESTGLIRLVQRTEGANNTPYYVEATEEAKNWMESADLRDSVLHPTLMPMIVPPKPWTTPYDGGYLTGLVNNMTIVKTNKQAVLDEYEARTSEMSSVYDAVNRVQETPWRVNQRVLDVLKQSWELGLKVDGIPARDHIDITPCPIPKGLKKGSLNTEQKEQYSKWAREATEVHRINAQTDSKRLMVVKLISVADKFATEEEIFFPHTMDFRGRIYAAPLWLQPQGADVAKGLLEFAHGAPVESIESVNWLKINLANLAGQDKIPMAERIQWVDDHAEQIVELSIDPMSQFEFWATADKPFQFLAAAFDMAEFLTNGYGYISRIHIQMDGSCNGLQHLSAWLRDEVGGTSVNLRQTKDTPNDIYQDVANKTIEEMHNIIKNSNSDADKEQAQKWLDFGINRSLVKRPVMVLPYGGTMSGCTEELFSKIQDKEQIIPEADRIFPKAFKSAAWMSKRVWKSINSTVIAAREAMDWLQSYASACNADELPVSWRTPDGFYCYQAYRDTKKQHVETVMGDKTIKFMKHVEKPSINKKKQRDGIAPNVVHSYDATALRLCVNRAAENGITQFAMVHDSFGCPAAQAPELAKYIRETFVEMYQSVDVLGEFQAQADLTLTDEAAAKLKAIPETGTLDLSQVIDSEFFFA